MPRADLTFAIAGAGGRGSTFSDLIAEQAGPGQVRAVADPNPERREAIAKVHGIPAEGQHATWQEMLAGGPLAAVFINTLMDRDHIDSATRALDLGMHMLLEKPMAVTLEDCKAIHAAKLASGRMVSVCHSLRYHASSSALREIIQSGVIGQVLCYDQLEAVENIHQSHSFVRGNWGREAESAFMLLAKCCHDIDLIADMIDRPCERVSSFGSLGWFRPENAPPGSPDFCIEGCPAARECPYEASKVYGDTGGWSRFTELATMTRQERLAALASSRFGRCVFKTGADVVDHQVVAMEFEGGVTATLTMTGLTPWGGRYIRVHGTKGYISLNLDKRTLEMWEFWKGNRRTEMQLPPAQGSHGGADSLVLASLIEAIETGDEGRILTTTAESLRSHAIVFMAELARRERRVVEMKEAGLD